MDQPISKTRNNQQIISKNHMSLLGVSFDSKLNWQNHIEQAITRIKKALNAIKLIRKYFNKSERLKLITSNYYSVLYFNFEIWHIPSNTFNSQKQLLSAQHFP